MATPTEIAARRPIKARKSKWASAWARSLARGGVSPNAISIFSVACAIFAAGALVATLHVRSPWGRGAFFLLAIVGIQARLICNLLDGMVAVEGGKKSKSGEVFNDLPDRLADPIILAAAGYAVKMHWGIHLGWMAAVMAVLTAYVRVLGRSVGAGIYFVGPMAKQHRMAVLSAACAVSAVVVHWGWHRWVMGAALGVIVIGCAITVIRRTMLIVRDLESK